MMNLRLLVVLAGLCGAHLAQGGEALQLVPVSPLNSEPTLDGKADDWNGGTWVKVPITPAVNASDRNKYGLPSDDGNKVGNVTVQLRAGIFKDRLFLALRWPDQGANVEHKGWEWKGSKYSLSGRREDMAAIRFHHSGDFDRSMLATKNYKADVWLWSAARTDPAGLAEDWLHHISAQPLEDAAEFQVSNSGTIYIKKMRDEGSPIYRTVRPPKSKEKDVLPSIEMGKGADGSVADVNAKGQWKGGYWTVEFSRKLNTGYPDDVVFKAGQKVVGQIAIWNQAGDENKSVSEPMVFDLGNIK